MTGNEICDVKGEQGGSNAWYRRNDDRNGNLVEYSATAAIGLAIVRVG